MPPEPTILLVLLGSGILFGLLKPKARELGLEVVFLDLLIERFTTLEASGETFRKGNTGGIVLSIQQTLQLLGSPIQATGVFDDATEQAVKGFQIAHALTDDGIVGRQTFRALRQTVEQVKTTGTIPPAPGTGTQGSFLEFLKGNPLAVVLFLTLAGVAITRRKP